MAEPLKNRYNQSFFSNLAKAFQKQGHLRDEERFFKKIFNENWEEKELKDRMRHITVVLHEELNLPYGEAVAVLKAVAAQQEPDFLAMFFPDFVEVYGLDENWETSMDALAHFTCYSSSEFAVRPFILQYPERMMAQMQAWARHENHHVRRLASEGCRPRLPWSMALPDFKRDPGPVLPILETLKADLSEYVRRSVANNLNDIAKDHPELVLKIASSWLGERKETDWIVKHACRTLLKKGHPQAMRLFGFVDPEAVRITQLQTESPAVAIGGELRYSFVLEHHADTELRLRLEYGIDYLKANGKHNRKVFMISENQYQAGKYTFKGKQSFRNMTTRKHYPGPHQLAIIVNGVEQAQCGFRVTAADPENVNT